MVAGARRRARRSVRRAGTRARPLATWARRPARPPPPAPAPRPAAAPCAPRARAAAATPSAPAATTHGTTHGNAHTHSPTPSPPCIVHLYTVHGPLNDGQEQSYRLFPIPNPLTFLAGRTLDVTTQLTRQLKHAFLAHLNTLCHNSVTRKPS